MFALVVRGVEGVNIVMGVLLAVWVAFIGFQVWSITRLLIGDWTIRDLRILMGYSKTGWPKDEEPRA